MARQPSRARTVARNVAVSALAQAVSSFSVLAVTPLLVVHLGLEGYGVWALLNSVVRYGFLADFGLGPTIVKYAAECVARRDASRLAKIMTFGALFPLLTGALCVGAVSQLAPAMLSIFKIPEQFRADAPWMLTALLGYLFLFIASAVLTALLKGIGRLDVSAITNAAGLVTFSIAGALLVTRGAGIAGLIQASYAQLAITAAANYVYLRRSYGPMFCNPLTIDAGTIRTLLPMSGWIQVSVLLAFLGTETTTFVAGIFLSVSAVGLLDIGNRLARGLGAIGYHFGSALLPAVAQLEVESGTDAAHAIVADGSRYVGVASIASFGLLVACAPLVLRVWLGNAVPDVAHVALVTALLSAGWVVANIVGVGTIVLRAVGRPRLETTSSAIAGVSNLALTLVVVTRFGLIGVLCAGLFSALLGAAYFVVRFDAIASISFARALRSWLPPVALATALCSAVAAAAVAGLPARVLAARLPSFAALLALCVPYVLLLVALLRALRFFRPLDLALAERLLPAAALPLLRRRIVRRLFAALP